MINAKQVGIEFHTKGVKEAGIDLSNAAVAGDQLADAVKRSSATFGEQNRRLAQSKATLSQVSKEWRHGTRCCSCCEHGTGKAATSAGAK